MKRFVKTRRWVNNIIKDNLRYITTINLKLFDSYRYICCERISTFVTKKQDVNLKRLFDIATNFSNQTIELLKTTFG